MRIKLSHPLLAKLLLVTLFALPTASELDAQIRYTIEVPEVFGNPINRTHPQGNEINENGETLLNRVATFAIWKNGSIFNIVDASGDHSGSLSQVNAASINEKLQVVGTKTYRVRDEEGVRYDTFPFYWHADSGLVDLAQLGERSPLGAGFTSLFGINNEGVALGTTEVFEGEEVTGTTAFTWSLNSDLVAIPALVEYEGSSVTKPTSINDSGTVVGIYREFTGSFSTYNEKAFVFDSVNGSRDLSEVDEEFFHGSHYTSRDINSFDTFVGELGQEAYIYDMQFGFGTTISSPDGFTGATKAYALNDLEVVVGTTEKHYASGYLGYSPILWTPDTASIDLMPQLEAALVKILPQGVNASKCKITPKSINNRGQISASLETNASFSREILLQPVLDFQWSSMTETMVGGVRGVRYIWNSSSSENLIPVEALGYKIGFECSSDMKNWAPVDELSTTTIRRDSIDGIELFVPFSECRFIRPVLVGLGS